MTSSMLLRADIVCTVSNEVDSGDGEIRSRTLSLIYVLARSHRLCYPLNVSLISRYFRLPRKVACFFPNQYLLTAYCRAMMKSGLYVSAIQQVSGHDS